jgi:hypothetical protein
VSTPRLIDPVVHDPYHALVFVNQYRYTIAIWLRIDSEWWVTPDIAPGAKTAVIPLGEGANVAWQAVSENAINAYNLFNGTRLDTQSVEELDAWSDGLFGWCGKIKVTYGMLGRSIQVELF